MPPTSLVAAAAVLAVACLALIGPGWLLLRLVRVRGLLALALAPACSTAVLGCGAVLAGLLGVRWGWPAAIAAAALAAAIAVVLRRWLPTMPREPRIGVVGVLGITVGLLLAVVPTLAAAGAADAYLQRWDAVFHLAALRLVEDTGSASSLTLGALAYGDGRAAIYPAGWHALAALLPGAPTAVLTLGSTVTAAVPWVLGCAALTTQLWRPERPAHRALAAAGGLLAGVVTAGPTSLWVGWGHVPNAAGFAMVPAVVALGLVLAREREGRAAGLVALGVALLGVGLAHPNAALAAALLLLPALTALTARSARADRAAGRRLRAALVPVVVLLAVVAAVVVLLRSPLAAAVTGYEGLDPQGLPGAVVEVVLGRFQLWPSTAGIVLGLAALAAAVVAARQRRWLGAAMLGLAWVLYLDSATGGPLALSTLWYTSAARTSVVVSAVVVPLAAGALVGALRWARADSRRWPRWAPGVVATVLLVAVATTSAGVRSDRTVPRFDLEPGNPPQFVTSGELAMIADLPGLPPGTFLGSPFSGASSAYGLVGVPVVFPVAGQVWSADQQLLMDHLPEIADGTASAEVCDALRRLDVRYLYQDTAPYQVDHRYTPLDELEVAGRVVAEADTARVVELPTCS